jgi:hypothetical protein
MRYPWVAGHLENMTVIPCLDLATLSLVAYLWNMLPCSLPSFYSCLSPRGYIHICKKNVRTLPWPSLFTATWLHMMYSATYIIQHDFEVKISSVPEYSLYRVSKFLAGHLNWLPPPPPPEANVSPQLRGGHTLACGKGVGGRGCQFRRRDRHYGTLHTNPLSLVPEKYFKQHCHKILCICWVYLPVSCDQEKGLEGMSSSF